MIFVLFSVQYVHASVTTGQVPKQGGHDQALSPPVRGNKVTPNPFGDAVSRARTVVDPALLPAPLQRVAGSMRRLGAHIVSPKDEQTWDTLAKT